MLYDQVYEQILKDNHDSQQSIFAKLQNAQRFSFEESFTKTARVLANQSGDIRKALQYVKLPYDVCWFEFPDVLFGKKSAKRIGILLKNEIIDEKTYISYNMSMLNLQNEVEIQEGFLFFHLQDLGETMKVSFLPREVRQDPVSNDLTTCTMYCICGMLILLNQPKFIEKETADLTKLNKARVKRGKREFADYTTILVKPEYTSGFNQAYDNIMDERHNILSHTRRGHFKVLKSGKVSWWSPHIVNKERGKPASRRTYKA